MTFTYDLTTDIGKVRLLISDKVNAHDAPAHFSDEELQVFLTSGGSVRCGAAQALEAWAASLTDSMDSERMGDYSYTKKLVANKLELATRYRADDAATPSMDWAEFDLAVYMVEDEDV
jgi:hypothetical protein